MLGQRRDPAKPRKKPTAYVLPLEKLEQREQAFLIYQGMGVTRSFPKLEQVMAEKLPELKVSRTSLEKWSRQHDWAQRCELPRRASGDRCNADRYNSASTHGLPPLLSHGAQRPS